MGEEKMGKELDERAGGNQGKEARRERRREIQTIERERLQGHRVQLKSETMTHPLTDKGKV